MFLSRPTKDDTGSQQQIVLAMIDSVRKFGQVIVDLDDSNGEDRVHRYIDPSAHAYGKRIASISIASPPPICVRRSCKGLSEWLRSMRSVLPQLRKIVASSSLIRG